MAEHNRPMTDVDPNDPSKGERPMTDEEIREAEARGEKLTIDGKPKDEKGNEEKSPGEVTYPEGGGEAPADPLVRDAKGPASERSPADIAKEVQERRALGGDPPPLVPELTESGDAGERTAPNTRGKPVEAEPGKVGPPSDAEQVQLGAPREDSAAPDADNPTQKQNQLPGPQVAQKPPIPEERHIPTSEDRQNGVTPADMPDLSPPRQEPQRTEDSEGRDRP